MAVGQAKWHLLGQIKDFEFHFEWNGKALGYLGQTSHVIKEITLGVVWRLCCRR